MMKIKQKNLFLFSFMIWFTVEFMVTTTIKTVFGFTVGQINSLSNYLVMALLMVQIFFLQTYRKGEIIIIALMSVPFLIMAAVSRNYALLSAWMFIVAAKDVDFDRVINAVYKALCVLIPLVMLLCLTGIIEDNTKVRGEAARYSLGFVHPNQLGVRLLLLMVCHFYIHRKKIKRVDYGIAFAVILFVYFVPNSQAACMCILFFIALLFLYQLCRKYKQAMLAVYGKIMLLSAALVNAGSVFFSLIDVKQNSILRQIDAWVSARFSEGHKTLQVYGMPLWGQQVYVYEEDRIKMGMTDGAGRLWIDNAYMLLLIKYGIVSYIIFSVSYLLLINYYRKKEQYFIVIILLVYAVYGVIENGLVMACHNIFLILFADMLYEKLKGLQFLHAMGVGKGSNETEDCK